MTPIESLLAKSKEFWDKSPKVNLWYTRSNEVRGPFGRRFTCSEVNPEYKKHVADTMNTGQAKDEIIKIAVEGLIVAEHYLACTNDYMGSQRYKQIKEALSRINEIAAGVMK